MKQIRINESSPFYIAFKNLYQNSFPIFEQRTDEHQLKAFSFQNYHLDVYVEEKTFIGFIAYWEFDEYLYIEHFAIAPELRGKGYGGTVLNLLKASMEKPLLLEIDPVTDAVSANRLHFYEQNGFYSNPYEHIHPPYRDNYQGHSLVILTTKGQITRETYERFAIDLRDIVMGL